MGLDTRHSCHCPNRAFTHGFTLIELLVVLVIAGITLGLITLNAIPNKRQALQSDAQRIALLLQLARDEAIVRNRPIAFEAGSEQYRFLVFDQQQWQAIGPDDLLRERTFQHAPVILAVAPASPLETTPMRIIFGQEPVDKPFILTLFSGTASASIRADGIGHFVVVD